MPMTMSASKLFGGMACPLLSLLKIPAACRCSDSGDDLDPSLVHRLEPLSLFAGDPRMGWHG